jgi:vacuolar-type H+-ATPase subunit F/Vma7
MMPGHLNIAVMGDEDLVSMLRLAGLRHYRLMEPGATAEDARRVLDELIKDPDISVIAIQEDYVEFTRDMIIRVQESKSLTPVIVEVPSKHGTKYPDVTQYYKAFVSKFVGFEIEI